MFVSRLFNSPHIFVTHAIIIHMPDAGIAAPQRRLPQIPLLFFESFLFQLAFVCSANK